MGFKQGNKMIQVTFYKADSGCCVEGGWRWARLSVDSLVWGHFSSDQREVREVAQGHSPTS